VVHLCLEIHSVNMLTIEGLPRRLHVPNEAECDGGFVSRW
jgi:hypothetical protein